MAAASAPYAFPAARLESCAALLTADLAAVRSWRAEKSPCEGVDFFTTSAPGTSLRKNAAVGRLACAPARAARLLFESGPRLAWDSSAAGLDELAREAAPGGDTFALLSVRQKRVLVVSPREFLIATMMRTRPDGGIFAVATDAGGAAPPRTDCIRGEVFDGSAWCVTPAGDGECELFYTIFADPRGGTFGVPHAVVNAAMASTIAGFFKDLRAEVAKPAA